MAGRSAVAAVRAVTVEDGPGLTAASAVFTTTGRTPERREAGKDTSVSSKLRLWLIHLLVWQLKFC